MGNKGSSRVCDAGEKEGGEAATVRKFVLTVPTHCRCLGCTGKLRAAVTELAVAPGVLEVDQSGALATWEVAVLATADPERLRRRVSKVMGKTVGLVSGSGGGRSVREDQPPPPSPGHRQYGGYVDAYPPSVPPYYPGPPAHAWVPYVHPCFAAPAPAPLGPYWPSAPRWAGGPGY
ncbi:hypothetical protein CFC21_085346 [Triticum aestivum]|uniref:HMA domain-containing protein n=2 Tax=Triticum aestivum TaxID=4565 RepID=A0A3B6NV64_WHEAT|nr:hypothetical protein CFC21_085346 [Triticum aestivum]